MKLLLLLLFFLPQQIFAEQLKDNIPPVDAMSAGYLVKLIVVLGFILLLIFVLAWLMKKMQLTQSTQNGLIKIVSATSVGPRDRIALIQVGEEQLLVGLTPGRIEKIHTLKNCIQADQNSQQNDSFSEKFNQFMKRDKTDAQ